MIQGILIRIGIGTGPVRVGIGARSGGLKPVTRSAIRTDWPVSKQRLAAMPTRAPFCYEAIRPG
jgi:hypothetical protein